MKNRVSTFLVTKIVYTIRLDVALTHSKETNHRQKDTSQNSGSSTENISMSFTPAMKVLKETS